MWLRYFGYIKGNKTHNSNSIYKNEMTLTHLLQLQQKKKKKTWLPGITQLKDSKSLNFIYIYIYIFSKNLFKKLLSITL